MQFKPHSFDKSYCLCWTHSVSYLRSSLFKQIGRYMNNSSNIAPINNQLPLVCQTSLHNPWENSFFVWLVIICRPSKKGEVSYSLCSCVLHHGPLNPHQWAHLHLLGSSHRHSLRLILLHGLFHSSIITQAKVFKPLQVGNQSRLPRSLRQWFTTFI